MTKAKKTELVNSQSLQQMKFLDYYTNPTSETFGNIRGSGIKAGFTAKYAENIRVKKPKWFTDYLVEFGRDLRRLEQSEKVFDDVLALEHVEDAIGAFGVIKDPETGKPYKRVNTNIIREKVKVSSFIGETIGRSKYSKKLEIVGSFSSSDLKEYD